MELESIIKKTEDTFDKYDIHIKTLYQLKDFPMNLWKAMAEIGLLGLNIPKQYGGLGFNNKELIHIFEDLTKKGFPLGIALSWLTHLGLANFLVLPFATKKQREFLLPQIARGQITLSLAYGEIGSGGSPKRLKTTAILQRDTYSINGRKDFITNGNLAEFFAVFPITGERDGIKEVSAFLVSKDNVGINITKPIDVKHLNPSLHCSAFFEDCRVGQEDLLGEKGKAYDQILKPWREYEDIYIMGALIGSMHRQLNFVMECLNKFQVFNPVEYNQMEDLYSTFQVFRTIIYETVSMLDEKISNHKMTSFILSARSMAMKFQSVYRDIILKYEMKDEELEHVTGSIYDLLKIAEGTFPIRRAKLGKSLINLMDQGKGSL